MQAVWKKPTLLKGFLLGSPSHCSCLISAARSVCSASRKSAVKRSPNPYSTIETLGLGQRKHLISWKNATNRASFHSSSNNQFFFKSGTVKHNIVYPTNVSESREVPDEIPKPPYITEKYYKYNQLESSPVEIKSESQIEGMRASCSMAADILHIVGQSLYPGMPTDDIDQLVHELIVSNGAYPSPLHYKGFPKSVCTSVNNVACHGIPDDRRLEEGDILNVDITLYFEGFHGDTSATFAVGEVDDKAKLLMTVAEQCRDRAVAICGPGVPFTHIGAEIERVVTEHGNKHSVIPDFCGHGIGSFFHGPPCIVHVELEDDGQGCMEPGMTFTIEPIISEGGEEIKILSDEWTAVSLDGSRSAQYEHTVLITQDGVEILTE